MSDLVEDYEYHLGRWDGFVGVVDDETILAALTNAFDPFEPLPANDPRYVDCRAVRGDEDVIEGLGRLIERSQQSTCQLYTGHRGVGKSTELLRLQDYLQKKNFLVVYFSAVDDAIDPEDTRYVDVLLACTRHIVEQLRGGGGSESGDGVDAESVGGVDGVGVDGGGV